MKREILLSLGILFCVNSFAQNIKIEEQNIKESDNKVSISFTLVSEKVKSNERLTLTPILYGGDRSKNLTPIIIVGGNRAITDKRHTATPGIKTKRNQRIPYSVTEPYESWMADVSLRIDSKVESCCTEQILASQAVVHNKPIRYDVIVPAIEHLKAELTPVEKMDVELPFLAPMSEYTVFKKSIDRLCTEGALIVQFRQGKKIIDPLFKDNAKSLDQVRKVLKMIENDPRASVGKIVLAGTASPEGTLKFNETLSQQRVAALLNYLEQNVDIDINAIESINIGEDWTGLRQMVEASDMQYKKEVLNIINTVPLTQGREKQLMDLKWGRPYHYMQEHFFPKLRNAGYIRVFYESKPDMEFKKTNEVVDLYRNKEYRNALTKLEGIKATAATEYIRGVCHMMIGELDKAKIVLDRALELGNTQALDQLRQIEKMRVIER